MGPLSFRLLKSATSDCSSLLRSRLRIEAVLSNASNSVEIPGRLASDFSALWLAASNLVFSDLLMPRSMGL